MPPREPRNIRVLLVDDEPWFRSSLGRLLQVHGFQVLEADGADTALTLMADPQSGIDVALVDVVLPGTNGFALSDRFREKDPALRVLMMSGYPAQILQERYGLADGPVPILQKPLDTKKLIAKILEVLGRADGG
jgi:two-component system, cell cycle sensor histidine kinase and response regulator CckA